MLPCSICIAEFMERPLERDQALTMRVHLPHMLDNQSAACPSREVQPFSRSIDSDLLLAAAECFCLGALGEKRGDAADRTPTGPPPPALPTPQSPETSTQLRAPVGPGGRAKQTQERLIWLISSSSLARAGLIRKTTLFTIIHLGSTA